MVSAKSPYPTHAYLYVIGTPGGPFKVGYSASPKSRKKAFERAGKDGVSLVTEQPIPYRIARCAERYAHWLLREHHLDHEWFNVPREQAVEAIKKAVSPEVVETYNRYHMIPVTAEPANKLKHGEYITTKFAAGTRVRLQAAAPGTSADFIRQAVEEKLARDEAAKAGA